MASHMRARSTASHLRGWSLRAKLGLLVLIAALVMTIANLAVRSSQAADANGLGISLPTVVLASGGQSANRIAVDTSALHSGADVEIPVQITNAGNQTIGGVIATLAGQTPGIQLAVDAVSDPNHLSVAPGSTVQYRLRLHAIAALTHPKQVVVAFSPASNPLPAPAA